MFYSIIAIVALTVAFADDDVEKLLGSGDAKVRLQAPGTIAKHGNSAIGPLVKFMNDKSKPTELRWSAVRTLGLIGSETAIEKLRTATDDKVLRLAAAEALGEIGPKAKSAAPDLAKVLTSLLKEDGRIDFKPNVIEAIQNIGDGHPDVIAALERCMEEGRNDEAASALQYLGDPGIESLVKLATKYELDKSDENARRYGEAYAVLVHREKPVSAKKVLLFHVMKLGPTSRVAALGLARVGAPAKADLMKLLEREKDGQLLDAEEARLHWLAAESLMKMRFIANTEGKKDAPEPVTIDELFPKLKAVHLQRNGKVNSAIVNTLTKLDLVRSLADPEIRAAMDAKE